MELEVKTIEKQYPIKIEKDILLSLDQYIDQYFKPQSKILFVIDQYVDQSHHKIIRQAMDKISNPIEVFKVKGGEELKTIAMAENLYHYLANHHWTRKDAIVAIGGGTVGDLVGFVASTYMRGIDFANIPTTLLSQVDSSVGGKNALNLMQAKNVIGTFYQPSFVLIDPQFLSTLTKKEFQSGLVEMIKIAVITDRNLFKLLESDFEQHIISSLFKAIDDKRKVVEKDEKEKQYRMILNFGHTLGHAFEKMSQYQLPHGIAVGIGMVTLLEVAHREKWITNTESLQTLKSILQYYQIPIKYPYPFKIDELFSFIQQDKKNSTNNITIVLSDTIGSCFLKSLTTDELFRALKRNEDVL